GALVDNGQHVLLGCYRETFAFLREIGAADNVRLDRQLAVTMIDREGRKSRLSCPPLPPPLHLLAGVLEWSALSWRDRLSIAAMATPLKNARRELAGGPVKAASADETVEQWLVRNGQTPRLREMLGHPLAPAAPHQAAERAAASPIVSVNLWFDRPIFDEPLIGLPGRAMQWAFNKSAEGGDAHGGHEAAAPGEAHVSLVSSGADAMLARTNEDLIRAAHDELLHALPASRAAKLLRGTVVREPRATFSLAPGQPPRPPAETGVKGL